MFGYQNGSLVASVVGHIHEQSAKILRIPILQKRRQVVNNRKRPKQQEVYLDTVWGFKNISILKSINEYILYKYFLSL